MKDLDMITETVYEAVLTKEIEKRGYFVESQKSISFEYGGKKFEDGFRVDLLIEKSVVVEIKSVENLGPAHKKQLLTYIRLLNLQVGLLINFGASTLKEGLHRIVNLYQPSAAPRPLLRIIDAESCVNQFQIKEAL